MRLLIGIFICFVFINYPSSKQGYVLYRVVLTETRFLIVVLINGLADAVE